MKSAYHTQDIPSVACTEPAPLVTFGGLLQKQGAASPALAKPRAAEDEQGESRWVQTALLFCL